MSAFEKKYISQNAGLSYKAFLRHFEDQAKGSNNIHLFDASQPSKGLKTAFATPRCHNGVVLIDMADKKSENSQGEKIPRLEIVDPNEQTRRQVLDELSQRDLDRKIASARVKTTKKRKRVHSSSSSRKVQTSKKRKTKTRKLLKRVKDLFDE